MSNKWKIVSSGTWGWVWFNRDCIIDEMVYGRATMLMFEYNFYWGA
jgi:hypothetical protein